MRSAGVSVDFIPPDILARLRFHPRLADEQHTLDRVIS
jgi:hypothetical protein